MTKTRKPDDLVRKPADDDRSFGTDDLHRFWVKIVHANPELSDHLAEGAWFARQINLIGDAAGYEHRARYSIDGVTTDGLSGYRYGNPGERRDSLGRINIDIPPFVI